MFHLINQLYINSYPFFKYFLKKFLADPNSFLRSCGSPVDNASFPYIFRCPDRELRVTLYGPRGQCWVITPSGGTADCREHLNLILYHNTEKCCEYFMKKWYTWSGLKTPRKVSPDNEVGAASIPDTLPVSHFHTFLAIFNRFISFFYNYYNTKCFLL